MNQNQLKGRLLALDLQKEEAEGKTKRAVSIMFAIAGLNVLFAVLYWFQTKSVVVFAITLLIGLIIFSLALWARKKPLIPLVIALILLSLLYSADMMVTGSFNIFGIAIRLAIILFLILGIYNVYHGKKVLKRYNDLKSQLDEKAVNE